MAPARQAARRGDADGSSEAENGVSRLRGGFSVHRRAANHGGTQTVVLNGFPTPAQIRVLGPNTGTSNRYAAGRLRKSVQDWVKIAVGVQGIVPVPPPVRVTLRYVMPDARHRDADNFAIVGKPAIDGLVRSGVLEGDNAARCDVRVEFVKEKGRRALEIVIEEVA